MPKTGLIDPWVFRTSQKTGGKLITGPNGTKKPILDNINDLRSGNLKPSDLTPIRLVKYKNQLWTLDHRRVIQARLAGRTVKYEVVEPTGKIIGRLKDRMKTPDNGVTIRISEPKSK